MVEPETFDCSVEFDLPSSEHLKNNLVEQSFEVKMEATTIDQLFPDVLEEIFSHLSGSDLKNCARICKDWDDVIGSYATTMKKMKIELCLHRDHISIERPHLEGIIIQSSDESHRKHRNVEILINDGSLAQLPSLDRFNMSQVRSLGLHFLSSGSIELNKVTELLSRMPLLQMLTITFRAKCTLDCSNTQAANFAMLKKLNVQAGCSDQPTTEIFEFINADNLTDLTYYQLAEYSDAEIDALADFMKSKKSLVKLNIKAGLFTQLHRRHDFSGMNLESLNIIVDRSVGHSDILIEKIRKSLISNAHSLTSLSIPSWLISKKVLVTIFNHLRKLTTLDIDSHFADVGSWMGDLSPNDISCNQSMQSLKITRVRASTGLRTFLQRAPQLKKLTILQVIGYGDIINEVATSAPRLVELSIDFFREVLRGDKRFVELKSLSISWIYSVDALASVVVRCPKIETFDCQYYRSEDTSNIVEVLLQQKTLKHLRFNLCAPESCRSIFDKLKGNYGNLRSLKLGAHRKFISFDFPENPAEWNVEEQEARFSDFEMAQPT